MPPAHPPPLSLPDYVGPVVGAAIFVLLMGFVNEPARRTVNAVIVAGATGVYISGGGAPSARHAIQNWSEHRRLAPRP